jgi:hypothetical protein
MVVFSDSSVEMLKLGNTLLDVAVRNIECQVFVDVPFMLLLILLIELTILHTNKYSSKALEITPDSVDRPVHILLLNATAALVFLIATEEPIQVLRQEKITPPPEIPEKTFHRNDPVEFDCPITLSLMIDPVIAADGFSYEREYIQQWIDRDVQRGKTPISPKTQLNLEHNCLTSNRVLLILIDQYRLTLDSKSLSPTRKPSPPLAETVISSFDNDVEEGYDVIDSSNKKNKKAKETPDQRVARLDRQRLAKVKKLAEEELSKETKGMMMMNYRNALNI